MLQKKRMQSIIPGEITLQEKQTGIREKLKSQYIYFEKVETSKKHVY